MEGLMHDVELIGRGRRLYMFLGHFLPFGAPISSAIGAPEPPRTCVAPLLASAGRISSTLCHESKDKHSVAGLLTLPPISKVIRVPNTSTQTADQGNARDERGCNHPPGESGSLPDTSSATSRRGTEERTELRCIMSTHLRS